MVQDFSNLTGQNNEDEEVDFGSILKAVVEASVAQAKEEQRKFIEEENIPENPGRQLAFSPEEDRIIFEFYPAVHEALLALEDAVSEADTRMYEALAEANEENYPDDAQIPLQKLIMGFRSFPFFQACLGTQEQFDRQLNARERVIKVQDEKNKTDYLNEFYEKNAEEIAVWNKAREKRNFKD